MAYAYGRHPGRLLVQVGFRGRRHDVEVGPDGWWLYAVPAAQDERLDLRAIPDPLVSDPALGTAD